jgi:hypothetical protein
MGRFLTFLAAILGLCGCDLGPPNEPAAPTVIGASVLALDAVSVINTQKTIDDHIVSFVTGQDCSTIRASKGDHYCIDEPVPVPMVQRTSYCYKTLAKVTCYDRPMTGDAAQFFGMRVDEVPSTIR